VVPAIKRRNGGGGYRPTSEAEWRELRKLVAKARIAREDADRRERDRRLFGVPS
jgi:hypothetical protein